MTQKILVVDDEKNIRTTIRYALEGEGHSVDTAINGEEALQKMEEESYALVLLDLRMPGINGIEMLAQLRNHYPRTRVAIISAHGNVGNAVEAMKLGAVDFVQKPFSPKEIRDLVNGILARGEAGDSELLDYEGKLKLARQLIAAKDRLGAMDEVKQAIALDPSRPQAFNLLGVLHEMSFDLGEAQKCYRVALDLQPTYKPALENLTRAGDSARRHESPTLD